MNKRTFITVMVAAMPTYFSVFVASHIAAVILISATLVAGAVTSFVDPKEDVSLTDKVLLGWCVHLVGICLSIAYHNM
jgi:hypothetical protein